MTHQPELLPDQPSPEQASRDAERAEYLKRLREKLKDPDFRAIEGFPIGEDEDILALSDPPYYTACPNPFLPEIIERWQAERARVREELGLPDDSADNGDGGEPVYHREPFAADVSEGKYSSIYLALYRSWRHRLRRLLWDRDDRRGGSTLRRQEGCGKPGLPSEEGRHRLRCTGRDYLSSGSAQGCTDGPLPSRYFHRL
jgi:hypothetical protein